MNDETEDTTTNPERVPRPDEVIGYDPEQPDEQKIRPLRCRAGSKADNPCPRDATTWMFPEDRDYPLCDEHARANELSLESSEWGVMEEITDGWLRVARAWGFEELEQLALNAHESAKEGFLKAEARAELAAEIADAPRKGCAERIANLTPEQDEELRQRITRSDGLNNAYTDLEDHAAGKVRENRLRRTLGVLVEEKERAAEEVGRYKEELGLRP